MTNKPPADKTQKTEADDEVEFETTNKKIPIETVSKEVTEMTQTTRKLKETLLLTPTTQTPMNSLVDPQGITLTTTQAYQRKNTKHLLCPITAIAQSTRQTKQSTYRRHRCRIPKEEKLFTEFLNLKATKTVFPQTSKITALSNIVQIINGVYIKLKLKRLLRKSIIFRSIFGIAASLLVLQFATTLGLVPPLSRIMMTWQNKATTKQAIINAIETLKNNAVLAVRVRYVERKADGETAIFPKEEGTYCPVLSINKTWSDWRLYKKDNENKFYEKYYIIWITNPSRLSKEIVRGRKIQCPVNVIRTTKMEKEQYYNKH